MGMGTALAMAGNQTWLAKGNPLQMEVYSLYSWTIIGAKWAPLHLISLTFLTWISLGSLDMAVHQRENLSATGLLSMYY